MYDDLISAIRAKSIILFVGAGVTATLGAPSWKGLIAHMLSDLGYDVNEAPASTHSMMTLAEFYRIQRGEIGPLRSWMDTQWQVADDRLLASPVHRLIAELDLPIIYTTNYDRFLERSLRLRGRDVAKIVNVRDIRRAHPGQTQVVKLHGDFDSDESIVLTESDFFRRLSLEGPLDIKLRSDMLGKSVLFIGYSLTDINIRLLIFKLNQAWESSGHGEYRPRSYIFSPKSDPIQELVLKQWGIELFSEDNPDASEALRLFLDRLVAKLDRSREADADRLEPALRHDD